MPASDRAPAVLKKSEDEMDYQDIREQVIQGCLAIQNKGLIRGTSGNISVRSADGTVMAISPSGVPYEILTPEMVPVVDMAGNIVSEGMKPSSELPMHLMVMNARPDVGSVVHTHSKFSIILSIIGEKLPVNTIPLIMMAPDPAPIVPFEFPGSPDLGAAVVKYLGDSGHAVIMEHHGLLTVGKDLGEALTIAEYVEEGAEIAYYCRLAEGKAKGISDDKIAVMLKILQAGRAL